MGEKRNRNLLIGSISFLAAMYLAIRIHNGVSKVLETINRWDQAIDPIIDGKFDEMRELEIKGEREKEKPRALINEQRSKGINERVVRHPPVHDGRGDRVNGKQKATEGATVDSEWVSEQWPLNICKKRKYCL